MLALYPPTDAFSTTVRIYFEHDELIHLRKLVEHGLFSINELPGQKVKHFCFCGKQLTKKKLLAVFNKCHKIYFFINKHLSLLVIHRVIGLMQDYLYCISTWKR